MADILKSRDKQLFFLFGSILVIAVAGLVSGYGGNDPAFVGHTWGEIEAMTGYIKGATLEYVDTTSIRVKTGLVEIDGTLAEISADIILDESDLYGISSFQENSMHYVYLEEPGSHMGTPTAHISIISPLMYDGTKGGKYHPDNPDWRYIGAFYYTSGIYMFRTIGNGDMIELDYLAQVEIGSFIASSWTVINAAAPPESFVRYSVYQTYATAASAYTSAYIRKYGETGSRLVGQTYQQYGAQMQSGGVIQCDTECRLEAHTTSYGRINVYQTGFIDSR